MNVKIACAYHTQAEKIKNQLLDKYPNIFVPVLGGAVNYKQGSSALFDSFYRDDDLDPNISELNPQYSEHAVIYWLYRHLSYFGDPDMIGLCHYRRFMDLDYDNLDYDTIYLRRCPLSFPDNIAGLLCDFVGCHVSQLVMDEYACRYPQFREATRLALYQPKLFDKCMFIMNRVHFSHFMTYSCAMYRLVFDPVITLQIEKWYHTYHDQISYKWLYGRSKAFFLEAVTAIYFTWLQMNHFRIVITQPTKDSFNEH